MLSLVHSHDVNPRMRPIRVEFRMIVHRLDNFHRDQVPVVCVSADPELVIGTESIVVDAELVASRAVSSMYSNGNDSVRLASAQRVSHPRRNPVQDAVLDLSSPFIRRHVCHV